MTHIYKETVPIYKTDIAIVFYTDSDELKMNLLGDEDLKELVPHMQDATNDCAFVMNSPGLNMQMAFFRIDEIAEDRFLIIHESFHLAWGTIRGVGMVMSEETEESAAYLQEYYIERIEELYKQSKALEEKLGN